MADDDIPDMRNRQGGAGEALERLDFGRLWTLCDGQGVASYSFEKDVRAVLCRYRPGPDRIVRMPAKERTQHYNGLEKAIIDLRRKFEEMHPHIAWELDMAGIDYEPVELIDGILKGSHEGLSYSEYLTDVLLSQLEQLEDVVRAARSENMARRGKPKQNSNLETTIRDLGAVYKKHMGREPMAGYRFNDIDESQPYQGPFLDFIQSALWTFNGAQVPSGYAIGEAARRAFGLRK